MDCVHVFYLDLMKVCTGDQTQEATPRPSLLGCTYHARISPVGYDVVPGNNEDAEGVEVGKLGEMAPYSGGSFL